MSARAPAEADPAPARVGTRTARGALAGLTRVAVPTLIIGAGSVVLSHLLTPADFGRYALALALTGFIYHFLTNGLVTSLICEPEAPSQVRLERISWSLTLVLTGIAGVIGIVALTVPGGRSPLVYASALYLTLIGLRVAPLVTMYRDFRFGRLALAESIEALAGQVVMIVAAVSGAGGASFAYGLAVASVVGTASMILLSGWRPGAMPALTGIGLEMRRSWGYQLSSAVAIMRDWLPVPLFATVLSAGELGLYSWAATLAAIPVLIASNLAQTLLPGLVQMDEGVDARADARLRAFRLVALQGALVCAIGAGIAPLLVQTLFAPAWEPAARISVWMLASCVASSAAQPLLYMALSAGRPRSVAAAQAASLVAFATAGVILGAAYGLDGIACAFVLGQLVLISMAVYAAKDLIAGGAVAAVLTGLAATGGLTFAATWASGHALSSPWLGLMLAPLAGMVLFAAGAWLTPGVRKWAREDLGTAWRLARGG